MIRKKEEQKKDKGSVLVAQSAYTSQNAKFGLVMFRKKQTSRIKSLKIGSTIYIRYEKNEPDRIVIEHSELNSQIEKTRWSLPRISDVIGSLDGYMLFSNLDSHSSFDQLALGGDSQNLPAFILPMFLYK